MSTRPSPFPPGTITEFAEGTPYRKYSNFYLSPVYIDGFLYRSGEHAYQALKSDDLKIREWIAASPTPNVAKKRGQTVELRAGWDEGLKFEEMYRVEKAKYAPYSPLERTLLSTGDVLIVEGNYWHDTTFGKCYCSRHNWVGLNRLGEILMRVRKEAWERVKSFYLMTKFGGRLDRALHDCIEELDNKLCCRICSAQYKKVPLKEAFPNAPGYP